MNIDKKQAVVNSKVEELYNEFRHKFQPWADSTVTERLRTCTAYVYKDHNGYIVLRSYNTFVAFITPNGEFVDVLRLVYGYTNTSAQHIRKFYNDYAGKCKYYFNYIPIKK